MGINLTKEIPDLAFLIEYSERIEQAEYMLKKLLEVQQNAAIKTLESLNKFENKRNIWFGEDLIVEFQDEYYLVKGLNDDENDPLKVRKVGPFIHLESKQTKGYEGEKEQS